MRPPLAAVALAALALLPPSARAEPPPDPTRTLSPYFAVQGGEAGVDALPLKSTSATVEIAGMIASVTVEQTYANLGTTPLHARYVFPASTRAAVHGLRMTVGQRTVEARIRERRQARAEFEQAKAQGKSASLLEQQRPNVFTMELSHILPGDLVKVELRYTELLVPSEGVYELVYPTVVLPRYSSQPEATAPEGDRWVQSPYLRQGNGPSYDFAFRAHLVAGQAIQEIVVPSHQVDVRWAGRHQAEIALAPVEKEGGNRDLVLRYRLAGAKADAGLLLQDGPDGKYFLLAVEPPERVAVADLPRREFVFIVDVSGSMHGFPLDAARRLLEDLIGGLRPTDLFDVVLFSGAHLTMAPRSVPATARNVAAASALIAAQKGGGGTELLPALQEAMALPRTAGAARSFIVVTDGGISQEKALFEYIRAHLGEANVFSFGIGSSVNRYLVEGVAKAGLGEAFVVHKPDEAPAVAAAFRRYVEAPVLTGIQVSFQGFEASEVEPRALPDLMAQRPVVLQGKWSGAARGTVTVRGRTGAGTFERVVEVGREARAVPGDTLRHLWARKRIAALSDFSAAEESDEERLEITRLGLEHGLLTRHTSFVAVLQETRNPAAQARQVDQPLPLPQGVTDLAVGDEPGLPLLAAAAGALGLLAWLHRPRSRRPQPAAGR